MAHQNFQFITEISPGAIEGVFTTKNSILADSYIKDGIDEETKLSDREGVTFTTSLYGANAGRGNTIFAGSTPNGVVIYTLTQANPQEGIYRLLSTSSYSAGESVIPNVDDDYTLCFLEDTLISVLDDKRVPVQDLKIGDKVLTSEGTFEKILWIGVKTVKNGLYTDSDQSPVCISAGALGNLPLSDLYVTANHGMIIDSLVINAAALVNDSTIRFVPLAEMPSEFTYYHIETKNHDEIYANGSLAETFVDYVTRSRFDNYQEYLDLFGSEKNIVEIAKPRVSAQRQLPSYLVKKFGITPHYHNIEAEFSELLPAICKNSDVNEWNLLLSNPEMVDVSITS
jgi:hypothetical protein